jgi:hypothetical protein
MYLKRYIAVKEIYLLSLYVQFNGLRRRGSKSACVVQKEGQPATSGEIAGAIPGSLAPN